MEAELTTEKEPQQTVSEAAGYDWFLRTDFVANLTTLWAGVERVAGATADESRLNKEEFVSGCANAFADAMNDFLFGEEEEEREEKEDNNA